jgi:phage shock protein C
MIDPGAVREAPPAAGPDPDAASAEEIDRAARGERQRFAARPERGSGWSGRIGWPRWGDWGDLAERRLYRSTSNRMLAGVAGGIAEYFGIDPTVVRVLWVLAGIFPPTAGAALLLYIVLAVVVPSPAARQ